ncbi:hypothetical protein CRG98_008811 [Punica granatum]|uniref:Uncharacterized protein n=1 Tax=Punica granatum TaxID=22663 RepID=A0A2I0KQQ0_PUNGR|nr:hypothetical protein CRG98_008811 [Punica granatum]
MCHVNLGTSQVMLQPIGASRNYLVTIFTFNLQPLSWNFITVCPCQIISSSSCIFSRFGYYPAWAEVEIKDSQRFGASSSSETWAVEAWAESAWTGLVEARKSKQLGRNFQKSKLRTHGVHRRLGTTEQEEMAESSPRTVGESDESKTG